VTLEAGLIASRFLHYVAVLSLFGAALFPLYIFGGRLNSFPSDHAKLMVCLRRILFCTVLLALVSGLGWFEFTTSLMADSADAMMKPSVLMSMMMGTDFGPLWAARLVLAGLVGILLMRWPATVSFWLVPALAGVLLASLADTGHARITEGLGGVLHMASDAAHLLAAGLWLGGLWPLGIIVVASLNRVNGSDDGTAIGEVLQRFSGVGTIAVAILVASGLVNSWFLVGSPGALISSTYGRMLLAKVVLFLMMTMLATANRFWITPQLDRVALPSTGAWLRRLRRHVVGEQVLGLLVLALVSVLGTLQPTIPA
jgi:putative copper resistance protein D